MIIVHHSSFLFFGRRIGDLEQLGEADGAFAFFEALGDGLVGLVGVDSVCLLR